MKSIATGLGIPTCDACGARAPEPIEPAVIEGITVWRCVSPTPCLNRARIARLGRWAR